MYFYSQYDRSFSIPIAKVWPYNLLRSVIQSHCVTIWNECRFFRLWRVGTTPDDVTAVGMGTHKLFPITRPAYRLQLLQTMRNSCLINATNYNDYYQICVCIDMQDLETLYYCTQLNVLWRQIRFVFASCIGFIAALTAILFHSNFQSYPVVIGSQIINCFTHM